IPMGLVQSHVNRDDLNARLLKDPVSQSEDEECGISVKTLYRATFDDLENNYVNCDTVLWILISLLLILAWGIGILMLIYLPIRRYILRQDIRSRTLYVTSHAIVYKVTRPAFLPCLGFTTMEKHVLLPLVTNVIIEQGCLQAVYGIHTIRVENLAHGKPTPVDEFRIQGVVNPRLFRKVILVEASKFGKEAGILGKTVAYNLHNQDGATTDLSLENAQDVHRSQSCLRVPYSAQNILNVASSEGSSDAILLHKLDEVERSVKRIEALVEHSFSSEASPRLSASMS
ncbi:hypothetical protein KI387_005596, partial [Taxus chinensis]